MRLKPLGDRLVVRAIEESRAEGDAALPGTDKDKPQKGEVLAVGDGKLDDGGKRIPLDVAEGDEILYSKYGGTEVQINGEELLVLSASDVLANIDKKRPDWVVGTDPLDVEDRLVREHAVLSFTPNPSDEHASIPTDARLDALRAKETEAQARVQQGLTRLRELAR